MPYIKSEDREKFNETIKNISEIKNAGELNYLITRICLCYIEQNNINFGYQILNDISGALANANLELYRRLTSDYEDSKIKENGDVY